MTTLNGKRSLGAYWARLRVDASYSIRRGAWYRVTQFAKENLVLEVPGTPVTVPRTAVDLVGTPPGRWTVVRRPPGPTALPEAWGQHYGVCPGCHHRAPLLTVPQMLRCPRCSHAFPVAWDESYLRV
jgi:hypothetical protein